MACKQNTDCASGHCVESVCCGTSACPTCTSCAIPGHEGTCTDIPKGVEDLVNHCEIVQTCDTGHVCATANMIGHFGASCSQDSDCFNGVCRAGLCKLALGDPCRYDETCASHLCTGHVCTACASDTDCLSGHCNSGICGLAGGAPCVANTDCGSTCNFHKFCIQTGNEPCTAAGCITHYCSAGNCQSCAAASDCPLGTPCTGGTCLAPAGAFCTQAQANLCASGMCPFPAFLDLRRCK